MNFGHGHGQIFLTILTTYVDSGQMVKKSWSLYPPLVHPKHKNGQFKKIQKVTAYPSKNPCLTFSCVIVAVVVALVASWLCWPPLPINLASLLSALSFPNRIQESSQALYSVFCHLLIYDHRGTAAQGERGGPSYHRPFDNQVICVRWPEPLSDFLGRTPHPRQKIMFNNAASE